jgi:hypothetical protein
MPAATTRNNEFSANGWSIDANASFQTKVDFHYNAVSSPAAWVGMTIEKDDNNYISIMAGADGNAPYFEYEQVVNGIVTSSTKTPRVANDGTLYISYDAALDTLYLSYNGYGAANAWQTITGLLHGQWSVSLGGGSDGSGVSDGQAYWDNFEVTSGQLIGWPPATDLDHSGFIDWGDVLKFGEYWLQSGPNIPADFDKNGIVDFEDFAEFALSW